MQLKRLSILPVLGALLALASCNSSDVEYHQTYFYPNYQGGMVFFADQQTDTIWVISTDSWTMTKVGDWFSLDRMKEDIPSGYRATSPIIISMQPNTTGEVRYGTISLRAHENLGMTFTQCFWHNITYPVIQKSSDDKYEITGHLLAADQQARLYFTNYQEGATLSTSSDWIHLPDSVYAAKELHELVFNIDQNPTKEERRAVVTLTSGGISTDVTYIQAGKLTDD